MTDLIDKTQVYDSRTRVYFEEVLTSYANGNYRSAVVMLYSVVLCDLMFKLQELRDVFSDNFARNLLADIEKLIQKDKASPAWEVKMVEEMHNNSPLLEADAYAVILHLRDWRNLSAHPVLDDYSQLFIPERHLVEGYICEAFNKILSRPAIFVRDIVSMMSEDLNQKKGYILNDKEGFKEYVEKKFLQRMTDAMYVKVFKSFWKFTFKIVNQECDENRTVNFHLLLHMIQQKSTILLDEMDRKPNDFEIADNERTVYFAVAFLAYSTEIWRHLSEQSKTLLNDKISKNNFFRLVAWFQCENKADYVGLLLAEDFCYYPEDKELGYVIRLYESAGLMNKLIDYFINLLRHSNQYTVAVRRMDEVILPFVDNMSKEQLDKVLEIMNTNSQLYDNYRFSGYCRAITERALNYFSREEIGSKYTRIILPDMPLQ